jgi:hypothetical protein
MQGKYFVFTTGNSAGQHNKKTRFGVPGINNVRPFQPYQTNDPEKLKKVSKGRNPFGKVYCGKLCVFFFCQHTDLFPGPADDNDFKAMLP